MGEVRRNHLQTTRSGRVTKIIHLVPSQLHPGRLRVFTAREHLVRRARLERKGLRPRIVGEPDDPTFLVRGKRVDILEVDASHAGVYAVYEDGEIADSPDAPWKS